ASAALARAVDDLRGGVVAPSRRFPEPETGFVRLSGHGRSVCRALGEPRGEDGFLVLKGTEPTCEDYEAWVEEQAARSLRVVAGQVVGFAADGGVEASMPLLEKWAVLEGKVPCAVTLEEAISEAERAADFQRAYLAAHGETARVPLPIAVH